MTTARDLSGLACGGYRQPSGEARQLALARVVLRGVPGSPPGRPAEEDDARRPSTLGLVVDLGLGRRPWAWSSTLGLVVDLGQKHVL
jgi:hypothetical protein